MKKSIFEFKDKLTRAEMKTIKGGDAVTCTSCSGASTSTCYSKYCHSTYCWFNEGTDATYLCQCSGDC